MKCAESCESTADLSGGRDVGSFYKQRLAPCQLHTVTVEETELCCSEPLQTLSRLLDCHSLAIEPFDPTAWVIFQLTRTNKHLDPPFHTSLRAAFAGHHARAVSFSHVQGKRDGAYESQFSRIF